MADARTDIELFTIGAYGYTAETFFKALSLARIDTFCDLRARRGVRGSEYSFVNSVRLQNSLADLGIAYMHLSQLAPPPEVRQAQYAVDKAARVAKRLRAELSQEFVRAYRTAVLDQLDVTVLAASLGPEVHRAVLFCVEREPAACHRSLVAEFMHGKLGAQVHHLLP